MDLRQLQYFLVTVEHRSFAHAAQVLHISQPALSKAIKRLEDSLGVPLLDRLVASARHCTSRHWQPIFNGLLGINMAPFG